MKATVQANLCRHTTRGRQGTRTLWAFSRADLQAALGLGWLQLRRAIYLGRVDPTSLESVLAYRDELRAPGVIDQLEKSVQLGRPVTMLYLAARPGSLELAADWCARWMTGCGLVVGRVGMADVARACDRAAVWDDPALARRSDVLPAVHGARAAVLLTAAARAAVEAGGSPWESRWRVGRSALAFSTALD